MVDPKNSKSARMRARLAQAGPGTRLVRGGLSRSSFGETSEAIFMTSGYVYESAESAEARFKNEEPGFVYSRYANPTVAVFEERLALIEQAPANMNIQARATASGMAAVTAAMLSHLRAGDHVVSARALFGSCRYVVEDLLPRFGIAATLVDGRDLDQWRAALRPETKALFLESPTNPTLELVDIAAVADLAHGAGAILIVDNVFATPLLQSPFALGADVVVYSATKHIDGHGRCLGGAILADAAFIDAHVRDFLRHTGPAISPFNAWVLAKSLEDMALRVHAASGTAADLADHLAGLPGITRVLYPFRDDHPQAALAKRQMRGGGALIAFEVAGGKAGAFRFLNALDLIDISNNLGDARSLITHPATTTHQRLTPEQRAELGISDGMVRLSVGLEEAGDLKQDLSRAAMALTG